MSTSFHRIALSKDAKDVRVAGKPTLRESWGVVMKTVDTIDEDLMKGYKEDIDTLLVFAGLFSAVVTSFAVESYQWLQEDPGNKSIELLTQIVQQLNNSNPQPSQSIPFVPSPQIVRINTYWFLSLTLALVDALFGLLCKQWVREHQRQASTHTPGQALALRWMRYQSFEQWHGPSILASLPILLEIALFLFLAGLLELLWSQHSVPFITSVVVVGLAGIFYLATTILPGLSIIQELSRIHPTFRIGFPFDIAKIPHVSALDVTCPYKSPQSWLMFRLFSTMYEGLVGTLSLGHTNISEIPDWSSLDLHVIQRFSSIEKCPDLYELKGFRWLVQQTRDMPSMRPHLKNVLGGLPPHLVMPTVFDWWELPIGKSAWSVDDIDAALKFSHRIDDLFGDQASPHHLGLASQVLCFRHFLATYSDYWARFDETGDRLAEAVEDLWGRIRKTPGHGRLVRALFRPEDLLIGPSGDWCKKTLHFYRKHWGELHVLSQVKLSARLSESILSFLETSEHDVESTLLASSDSLEFFTLVNDKMSGTKQFFKSYYCTQPWMEVLSHMRRIHRLPIDYFQPIPGHFLIPPNEFKSVLNNSFTQESVRVAEFLLDSSETRWVTAHSSEKEELVKSLTDHINQALLETSTSEPNDNSSTTSTTSSSVLVTITSDRGLQFVTFVNQKLAADVDLHDSESRRDTIQAWVDALERLRLFCQLPSDYFESIPMRRKSVSHENIGYYAPINETGRISTEVEEVGGGQDSEVNGEERTRQLASSRTGTTPEGRRDTEIVLLADEGDDDHKRNIWTIQETEIEPGDPRALGKARAGGPAAEDIV